MEGARILAAEARRKDLRFPFQKDFVARLEGQTVTGLGRRAKYLMADLSSGDVLLMHLGMSGSFRVIKTDGETTPGDFHHARGKDTAHDHVVFRMSSGNDIVFNDPRRFGYMKIIARNALDAEPLLKDLGPEPLGNAFDAHMLARACANKKTSLKAALLDQRVVAGLGNIYVCEALFRARLSPRRLAATLATKKGEPTDRSRRLVESIHTVLNDAIKARPRASSAISSIRSRSMIAKASRAERGDVRGSSSASPRMGARPSGVRSARSDESVVSLCLG
jgi:formamidopyrimidine-DNA glycosylase